MESLGAAVVERILSFLRSDCDFSAFLSCCKMFRRVQEDRATRLLLRIQDSCSAGIARCPQCELVAARTPEQVQRLQFLESTLRLIRSAVETNCVHQRMEFKVLCWNLIMEELLSQLEETNSVLLRVEKGSFVLNDSFDCFELSLRRYHAMITAMFPLKKGDPARSYICDVEARAAWLDNVGVGRLWVPARHFRKLFPEKKGSKALFKMINFLINFPEDDLLTVYKFNLLCLWFGPFKELWGNLEKFGLGPGFLGLINRIEARRLLLDYQRKYGATPVYMIRLSRTEPNFLVFSYAGKDRKVFHTLNRTSLSEKLNDFAEFSPIAARVSKDAYAVASLSNYALAGGYVHIDHSDDEKKKEESEDEEVDDDEKSVDEGSDYHVKPTLMVKQKPVPILVSTNSYSNFKEEL